MFTDKEENFFDTNLEEENNFFLKADNFQVHNNQTEPARRLNDYDYNILKEDAYRDVKDETFKLEYKISKIEDELKELELQIQSAKDIRDFTMVETLYARKKLLQGELINLLGTYNELSLSAKISTGITNLFSPHLKSQYSDLKKALENFKNILISILPQKFGSLFELKKSLAKLENINKNVDELMTMQTPLGESGDKYIQLSKYITRANTIQSEISKVIRN